MILYCYLHKDLSFSESWDQDTHDTGYTESLAEAVKRAKIRLIRYEVVTGEPFEFSEKMAILTKPHN